ncbi:CMGC protein kinase [Paracoccidioides brasiliensis Pb03]|nr:CMGC protein kinase [Paracoccidioides brasiliensis Pb03]
MDEHEYYPICLGEIVEKRYRVVHKLGHGAFSTVWLEHDLPKKVDVALKIMTADCEWNHEFRIQNEIIRRLKDTDTSNLLLYQNTFSLRGRDCDRDHRVLVFPVRGPSLSSPHTDRMSMAARMSAAKQLLKALESLHGCGIIHGDVSGGNVLWDMVSLDKYNTATKYKYLGRPEKAALRPEAWKTGELVNEEKIPQSLLRAKVYLSDFGFATDANNQIMNKWRPTCGYCAPERMHKFPASFAGDMWGYMCIFMSLYFRHSTFDRGLDAIVTALGPMPKEWKGLKRETRRRVV